MNKKRVVVIGGGITGLTTAYTLCKKNFDVTIIEKSDFVGGLAATFSYKNHLLDYGPHNFHTHIPGIVNFIKDELKVDLKRMKVTSSKLYFMGKFIEYPLKITDAVKNLNWKLAFRCFIDYIVTRITLRFGAHKDADSFEGWVKSRFGGYIYDLYFGPYVKKVWGIPGSELDVIVARRRIPEPSLLSLLVRALTGIRHGNKHSEDPEDIKSYYPADGIGVIAERLKDLIKEKGGRIELASDIARVAIDGDRKKRIDYSKDGAEKHIECDYIINTIPINDFVSMLSTQGIERIKERALGLSYRSIILLYMFLSIENVFDAPWIYFNEKDNPELIFNRMYEIGNFSRKMIHNKEGVICLEITCYNGDELWNSKDDDLFKTCIKYLEKNEFLDRKNVKEILTKRIKSAYPVFNKGYHKDLTEIINFLSKNGDVFSIGRQGLFSYANMDHCIDMGLKVEKLLNNPSTAEDFCKIYKNYLFS